MSCRAFVLVGVLCIGSPLHSADVATKAAQPDKERLICRTEDQIGSRLRKAKRCYTAREWADYTRQRQEATQEIQRGGSHCTVPDQSLC